MTMITYRGNDPPVIQAELHHTPAQVTATLGAQPVIQAEMHTPTQLDSRLDSQPALSASINRATVGGGSGGTSDYERLINKPQINDITLSGNKSFDDLGLPALSNLEIDAIVRRILDA